MNPASGTVGYLQQSLLLKSGAARGSVNSATGWQTKPLGDKYRNNV